MLWQRSKQPDRTAQESYRHDIEEPLKAGGEELRTFAEQMQNRVALGSAAFLKRLRGLVQGNKNEQKALRAWKRLLPFARVIAVVALEKKEAWETFRDRYGDEGRDVALWLGRRHCGLTLRELGAAAGGMTYPAVSRAVRAIEQRRKKDAGLCRLTDRLETQLLNI